MDSPEDAGCESIGGGTVPKSPENSLLDFAAGRRRHARNSQLWMSMRSLCRPQSDAHPCAAVIAVAGLDVTAMIFENAPHDG